MLLKHAISLADQLFGAKITEHEIKMEDTRFAIIQWSDKYTSVINLGSVRLPRKPVEEYNEGEYITALYEKKPYRARISEISQDRSVLVRKKNKNGSYPLKFFFEESQDTEVLTEKRGTEEKENGSSIGHEDVQVVVYRKATGNTGKERHSDDDSALTESDILTGASKVVATKEKTLDKEKGDNSGPAETNTTGASNVVTTKEKTTVSSSEILPKTPGKGQSHDSSGRTNGNSQENTLTPRSSSSSNTLLLTPQSNSSSSRKLERRVSELEKEVKDLKASLKSLKRKYNEVSEALENRGAASSSVEATSSTSGLGVDKLLDSVKHLSGNTEKEVTECVRRIALSVFTRQDLVTCSRTGKKTHHSGENIRPALDIGKFNQVEQAVLMKCSGLTVDQFKKKFDNLVKMERRSAAADIAKSLSQKQ